MTPESAAKQTLDPMSPAFSIHCLDHASLPMAMADGAMFIVRYANPAFCRLINRPWDELVGKSFRAVLADQAECLDMLDRVYRTGTPESYTEQEHSTPRAVFRSYTVWPVQPRGQARGVMIHVVETASLYEEAVAMNEALLLGSLHQHELTEVAYASNLALKIAEEALRQANNVLEDRVAERTSELTRANVKLQAVADERDMAEETLRQSQKMEAVGQLTGGIAHDFNNILQSIIGNIELMSIRVNQGRVTELGRYIRVAMASADRAAALTHRLLAFSRRQMLDPKPTDVNQVTRGMMELFARTVGPRIQITTRLTDGPWLALCDPNQVENALLNLVINSRDAMPDGGSLVIETANTTLPDRGGAPREPLSRNVPGGNYVTLAGTDTGTGMAPGVANRAFDPFFTTKPVGRGTGLGLSMIDGFVQQSGGHVRLQSREGQGTTVKIYLPRHLGASNGEEIVAITECSVIAAASAVVLVVEDDPAVSAIIVEALSGLGYTMVAAIDGRSGLHALESDGRIDLLVTDVGLPGGMNGRQLADAGRALHPGLNVLFITGYAETLAVGSDQLGPRMEIITKPFAINELATRICELMRSPPIGGTSE